MIHFIILIIAIPLFSAFLLPLIGKLNEKLMKFWVGLTLLLTSFLSIFLYKLILEKGTLAYTLGARFPSLTAPQGFPIRIILIGDALSGFLALFFLFIVFLSFLFSLKILDGYHFLDPVRSQNALAEAQRKQALLEISKSLTRKTSNGVDKFYTLYLLLLVGILGFLFTADFFTLFVFYEINSIATTGLIAFFRNKECFKSAFHYLAVFAVGSLFLLFGVGLLYSEYGFLNMAIIAKNIQFSFLDKVALSFIASALILKAGIFPFYFWKPEAYNASPVPAVILSIVSSLSALYVLFRISFDVFGLNIIFGQILILFSLLSIFAGVFLALRENNLKRILSYLAISELGYVVLGVSSGFLMSNTESGFKAIEGGLFHMVNDILDVGLLFLIAGIILYISRVRNAFEIRGFARKHPILAGFFLFGVLAISGLPPLNGFASKMMIYESVFHLSPVLTIIAILGSILVLAVLVKIFASIFLGAPSEENRDYQVIPKVVIAIVSIFIILMFSIGLFPKQFVTSFVNPAAKALISQQNYINSVIH